jgi:signal transduction histidine kinase
MTRSRVLLAFLLAAPAMLLAGVVMLASLAILLGEPESRSDAGLAQVGDGVALVVVVEELATDGLIDSGLLAPALALIPALGVAWWVAGRVKRVVVGARAEIAYADDERQSRLQEVVHELRTPLAVMGTNLELASLETSDEGATGYVDAARRAVDRMARTVDDLAGHGRLAVEQGDGPVDLAQIAEAAVAEHTGPGLANGVLVTTTGTNPVLVPSVDPAAVRSAIGNFLSNAVRLAPAGSTVSVDWGQAGRWAWLAVCDEGPGLAPQHHARVFERGWQGPHDRHRSNGRGETGLGLTISRQLTEAQGGAVTVDSVEGAGSTFAMWLPLEAGANRRDVVARDQVHPAIRPWVREPALLQSGPLDFAQRG